MFYTEQATQNHLFQEPKKIIEKAREGEHQDQATSQQKWSKN